MPNLITSINIYTDASLAAMFICSAMSSVAWFIFNNGFIFNISLILKVDKKTIKYLFWVKNRRLCRKDLCTTELFFKFFVIFEDITSMITRFVRQVPLALI